MAWKRKVPHKDGGHSYQVGWRDPAGKTHIKRFRTDAEANAWRSKVEVKKAEGSYVDPKAGKVKLSDFCVKHLESFTGSDNTRAWMAGFVSKWINQPVGGEAPLGYWPLNTIRRGDVQDFLTRVAGVARPPTVQAVYRVLRAILSHAVDLELIPANPALRMKVKAPERRDARYLSPAELSRIATSIEPRYRAFVLLMGYCGLRIGEAAALRMKNLDLGASPPVVYVVEGVVVVGGEVQFGGTKTRKGRSIRIPAGLASELRTHVADYGSIDPEALVFTTEDGEVIRHDSFRRARFYPACERAGVTPLPHVHDLRHTAVALAIKTGASVKEVQAMCGHASSVMTLDVYAHLFPDSQERTMNALDAMFTAAEGQQDAEVVAIR